MEQQENQLRFIGITAEGLLRPCEIYPVRVPFGHGYVWEWSTAGGPSGSQRTFDMFFDCLEDARKHGFEPHFLDGQDATDISVVPVTAPA